mmetsp:Transcript_16161/g.22331  ORF Transcript_16161/g.22331 Transcript_16161/m.22331 type:complete len:109 (+) Transcript_16161:167-493(+)
MYSISKTRSDDYSSPSLKVKSQNRLVVSDSWAKPADTRREKSRPAWTSNLLTPDSNDLNFEDRGASYNTIVRVVMKEFCSPIHSRIPKQHNVSQSPEFKLTPSKLSFY